MRMKTFKYVASHNYVEVIKKMGNMTLSMPEKIHHEMKHFSEIKWSEVARNAIIEKLEILKLSESLAKKSKLTKKDVDDFSKMIKKEGSKRFMA